MVQMRLPGSSISSLKNRYKATTSTSKSAIPTVVVQQQACAIVRHGNVDQLRSLFSLEYSEREPLRATQRDFMATRSTPSATLYRKDVKSGRYLDLGDTCSQQSDYFEGTQISYKVAKGSYCASPRLSPLHWSIQTKNQSLNLFSSSNLDLNADTTLFADILVGKNKTENDTRSTSWTSAASNQAISGTKIAMPMKPGARSLHQKKSRHQQRQSSLG